MIERPHEEWHRAAGGPATDHEVDFSLTRLRLLASSQHALTPSSPSMLLLWKGHTGAHS